MGAPNTATLQKQMRETNEAFENRLSNVEETLTYVSEAQTQGFEELKTLLAKNTPASITPNGTEVETKGPTQDIKFKDGLPEDDVELVELSHYDADSPLFKEKAERLAFDQHILKVLVHPSQSEFPDHTFMLGVNGKNMAVMRGRPVDMPRYYVETMARARISTYDNVEQRNPYSNELEVKNTESKSQRYPFQIIHDPDPVLGAKWLEGLMNERA